MNPIITQAHREAARKLIAENFGLPDDYAGSKFEDDIALAIAQAEQRGRRSGVEEAAKIVEAPMLLQGDILSERINEWLIIRAKAILALTTQKYSA